MSSLITLVGQQPSAVAVTVATLAKNVELERVRLMHTKKTQAEAQRLQSYIKEISPKTAKIDLYPISVNLQRSEGEQPTIWDRIDKVLQEKEFPRPVYYDISPGLNFHVALAARNLGEDISGLTPVYADDQHLRCVGGDQRWDLEEVDAASLLKLYGFTPPEKKLLPAGDIVKTVETASVEPLLQ
ncbi:MAG: hypothetical protein ACLFPI_11575, partial [Desulfobacterales bacterium]